MGTEVGTKACLSTERIVQFKKDTYFTCKNDGSDKILWSSGCLRILSKKSLKSVLIGALHVRPFHVTDTDFFKTAL